MDHLAFYNAGCGPAPSSSRLKRWARRLARKVLLPASLRLVEILASLCHRLDVAEVEVRDLRNQVNDLRRRQEDMAGRLASTAAFGWDYVAMVRRLSALEDHVELLLAKDADPAPASVRFPVAEPGDGDHGRRSRSA